MIMHPSLVMFSTSLFKKHIIVTIDIRNADKSVRVRTRNNEDLVGYVLNEMEEFSDWTARNPS